MYKFQVADLAGGNDNAGRVHGLRRHHAAVLLQEPSHPHEHRHLRHLRLLPHHVRPGRSTSLHFGTFGREFFPILKSA